MFFMRATVVITTKNRKDDLLRAIDSALRQSAKPEVLVMDDGSTDDTLAVVSQNFPTVRLHRSEKSLGLIVQRNRAARLAKNPIIFSIDDDAIFSTPSVVENTLAEFGHPRVGAVAIPFVNVNQSPAVLQRAPKPDAIYATHNFIGTAHALRRDLFLGLEGYREMLVHQHEEEDYCIRLLGAGYITRCGNADPIHHFESPRRNWQRMDYYGSRNNVLYAWHNVPLPYLVAHLGVTTAKTLAYQLEPDRLWTRVRGVTAAYGMACAARSKRQPVATPVYRLIREIKTRGPLPLSEIESLLPVIP